MGIQEIGEILRGTDSLDPRIFVSVHNRDGCLVTDGIVRTEDSGLVFASGNSVFVEVHRLECKHGNKVFRSKPFTGRLVGIVGHSET